MTGGTVRIRVFVCRGCGTRMTALFHAMPAESAVETGRCRGCGEIYDADVRAVDIAAGDLRYLERFGRDPYSDLGIVDVTGFVQ